MFAECALLANGKVMQSSVDNICDTAISISAVAIGLMSVYFEWLFISESFWQLFNPFLHLQVAISLLLAPGFWLFALVGIAAWQIKKRVASDQKGEVTDESRYK